MTKLNRLEKEKLLLLSIITLTFFVLISSSASAVLKSESAVLDVTFDLPISFIVSEGGTLSNLDVNFAMIPISDYRQTVTSSKFNREFEYFDGSIAKFKITRPIDTSIKANFIVETSASSPKVTNKVNFPINNLDPAFSKFIEPTSVYDINADIENLAVSIAQGEDDLFIVTFKLAKWVNENVEYDLTTLSPDVLPASWVLDNKRGVCTEYTSLFVSLARSLGIPAREVSGFAFTESDLFERGWEFHSWAEVYFPGHGWILFDPTYGQYGFIDAGHVKLSNEQEGELIRNSFSWRGKGVDVIPGQTDLQVRVLSREGSRTSSKLDVSYSVLEDEVKEGSYNFLRIDLINDNPYYVAETLRVSGVDGLKFISPRHQAVALAPYEKKSVYVIFHVEKALSSGFIYTFPLRFYLNDQLFSTNFQAKRDAAIISYEDIHFFLEEEKSSTKALACESKYNVKIGDDLTITCGVAPFAGEFCFDDVCKYFIKGDDLVLSKKIMDAGLFSRPAIFKSNQEIMTTYIKYLSIDSASVDLQDTAHSQELSPRDRGFVNVSIKRDSISVPKNATLIFKHDYFMEEVVLGDIDSEYVFLFSFPANNLKKGTNTMLLEVQFVDVMGENFTEQLNLDIEVNNLSFMDEVNFFFRRIFFWFSNLW